MTIRALRADEAAEAEQVCLHAFMDSIAPTLGDEGIATFARIAAASSFVARMAGDNAMLVHEHAGRIDGLIEIREGRHVAMLFVAPHAQGRGIGRRLLAGARPLLRTRTVTVSAALTSVRAYLGYGFVLAGPPAESSGLTYQPMEWTPVGPAPASA